MLLRVLPAILPGLAFLCGCAEKQKDSSAPQRPGGELVVFHAGSLAAPLKEVAAAFSAEYPGVKVVREAAGSRWCARKIADLGRRCDVMASSDYTVIENLLIPNYADWVIKFAANEIVIAYGRRSRLAGGINAQNWHEILARDDVVIARSDPNADPCGYRAVLVMKLAEKHYAAAGLAERLLVKDRRHIRPKETDLLALLELGAVDYAFLYRSLAEQHGLRYVRLPDEINLGNPRFADFYATVSARISSKSPGGFIMKPGAPIVYGVTIPRNAPNPAAARAFLEFLLDETKGMAIMRRNGQESLVPAATASFSKIPEPLRKFARKME